jgi:Lrp/AsnC family transcriptional regulator, leucine-responsive regulatory protein
MDEKDKLLLTLLTRNARSSILSLARELGLSRSATQDRLKRLTVSGAIAGFTILESRSTRVSQTAHMLITLNTGSTCAMVVPKIKKLSSIAVIHSIAGAYDLIVQVDGETMLDIEATRSLISAMQGVRDIETIVVLERHLR